MFVIFFEFFVEGFFIMIEMLVIYIYKYGDEWVKVCVFFC